VSKQGTQIAADKKEIKADKTMLVARAIAGNAANLN
jgi:hypothetical protein